MQASFLFLAYSLIHRDVKKLALQAPVRKLSASHFPGHDRLRLLHPQPESALPPLSYFRPQVFCHSEEQNVPSNTGDCKGLARALLS